MPINSRNKGSAAEREVGKIIYDLLGIKVERNLDQWRSGGYDLVGLDKVALEVKRAKKPLLNAWWKQTVAQANEAGLVPCLWYRLDRQQWVVVLPISQVVTGLEGQAETLENTVSMGAWAFATWYREKMR